MCHLYAMIRNRDAVHALFAVEQDCAEHLPPLPKIVPDGVAPVVRTTDGERELVTMRWGFPDPEGPHLITNIRDAANPLWRAWMKPMYRCLIPVTSFAEDARAPDPATERKDIVWFSLSKERPLFAFAGLWRPWTGVRGTMANPVIGDHLLYSFLTTEPNAVTSPINPEAMPMILHPDDWATWLNADTEEALKLRRPWPDNAIQIVARGSASCDATLAGEPPPEQDYGGGDFVSLEEQPSTEDDRPLE